MPLLGLLDRVPRCGGLPDPLPAPQDASCSRDAPAAQVPLERLRGPVRLHERREHVGRVDELAGHERRLGGSLPCGALHTPLAPPPSVSEPTTTCPPS